jgi:hypothetical protein
MERTGNWVEYLRSQVCVYQIERTVSLRDRNFKKSAFAKKTPKKKRFVILSVIKFIHYEIPTVKKMNTKKE